MRILALFLFSVPFMMAQPQPPGELVDLGGRRVHLYCMGQGSPAILILNGVPRFSIHYLGVQKEAAKFTRVCTYDRLGEAWSDPPKDPPSIENAVAELNRVVDRVGSPLILAGHSYGGVLARVYQLRRPEKVSGLVLIDSTHPDWPEIDAGGRRKPMFELTDAEVTAVAAKLSARRPAPPAPKIEPPFDRLPAELRPLHLWCMERFQQLQKGEDLVAIIRLQRDMYAALHAQYENEKPLGKLPLAVISRASSPTDESRWVQSQQEIAATSAATRFYVAVPSGHDVELDKPEVIVTALRQMVAEVRH